MAFNPTDGFLKILARFRNGQSGDTEQEAMETWYESLDDPDVDPGREAGAGEKVWNKINARTGGGSRGQQAIAGWNYRYIYGIAATLFLVCGFLGYHFLMRDMQASGEASRSAVTRENNTVTEMPVLLPDSSKIVLEPGARISYGADFNVATRTVSLKGDAFFSVTKNKMVPFIVNASGIQTKVLGTEFTVSQTSGTTQVEVISGRVQVHLLNSGAHIRPGTDQVVLTANLKATYQAGQQALVVGLVNEPQKTAEPVAASTFIFSDRPLKEVIAFLEKEYAVQIRTVRSELLNCPVTADLSGESLSNQLEIITSALNARFTVDQHGVLIHGGGCAPLSGAAPPHL